MCDDDFMSRNSRLPPIPGFHPPHNETWDAFEAGETKQYDPNWHLKPTDEELRSALKETSRQLSIVLKELDLEKVKVARLELEVARLERALVREDQPTEEDV